jgi:drug/metabolite transporter (DMT)-like permease
VLLYGAFQKASTASLAILGFIYPVVAVVVDYLAYGKVMNLAQLTGGALILVAAGAYAKGLKLPSLGRRSAPRI